MARLDAEIQSVRSRNVELYGEFEKVATTDKERALFAALSAERTSFNATTDDILKVSRAGTTASVKEAMEMTARQLKPMHKKYLEVARSLVEFNKSVADDEARGAQSTASGAKVVILISLGIAVLLGMGISLVITRSITGPLAAVSRLVATVAEGDLRKKAEVTSRDELGRMTEVVNGMVENLRTTVGNIVAAAANVATGSQEMSATAAAAFAGRHRAGGRRRGNHLLHGRDGRQHSAERGQRAADRQDRLQGGRRRPVQRRGGTEPSRR